jgi:hypothetical protein
VRLLPIKRTFDGGAAASAKSEKEMSDANAIDARNNAVGNSRLKVIGQPPTSFIGIIVPNMPLLKRGHSTFLDKIPSDR